MGVVVVTGAAGGMGRACARRLAARGTLLLTDVAEESLGAFARELRAAGVRVETQVSDVSDEAAVRALAERSRALGPLTAVAHTAGISPTMASWERILEVDFVGTARLLRAFLPLAEPGTAVVCVASTAGHVTGPFAASLAALHPAFDEPLDAALQARLAPLLAPVPSEEGRSGLGYVLAKYGVIRLCRREAAAWGARGARLVSLSPGIIATPMGKQEFAKQPIMTTMVERTPLQRMGEPEEIAAVLDFLLGPGASFVSGCDLLVDGGLTGVLHTET